MTTTGTRSRSRARARGQTGPEPGILPFFAEPVREYAAKCAGRPIAVLRAGCLTPTRELGLDLLQDNGTEFALTTADTDLPATFVGDLRTAPLRPRSFDIVHCSLLLERVSSAEVVLDRLTGALRPGGLLLLRVSDRDCAAGLLDRLLPGIARRALWRRHHPATPGPFPAIYEPMVSTRGIHGYALMRGLVIAARSTASSEPAVTDRIIWLARAACALVSWISRGRLTADHDQLLYVIRKPEDRFARVV